VDEQRQPWSEESDCRATAKAPCSPEAAVGRFGGERRGRPRVSPVADQVRYHYINDKNTLVPPAAFQCRAFWSIT